MSGGAKKKITDAKRSFQNSWLLDPDFKLFLTKRMKAEDKTLLPFCNACSMFLSNKKHNICSHMKSATHQQAMKKFEEKQMQQRILAEFVNNPLERNIRRSLELRLSLLVVRRGLAFSLPQEILGIFQKELPNNPVLSRATMGKTKTSNTIREAVGKFVTTDLANRVKKSFYSTIIDESTDVSTKNKMAIVLWWWDGKIHSEMLKLKRCKDATAEGLKTALLDQLSKSGIAKRQMVGWSADTCAAMFGEHNSVCQKLKADIPHLVAVKCACHIGHLCSSKAFNMLPSAIEDFIRQLPAFFSSSYKNKDNLVEFQEFCNTAQHNLLKPGFTRWLTLQPCAARIIEQFSPLVLFFTSLVAEKPNDSNTKMLSLLKDPFTKCYLEFLVTVLDKFNKFNATFQNCKPLLHELRDYIYHLILELSRCYMEGNYVNRCKSSPMKIDPKKETSFLSLKNIYIGGLKADDAIAACQQPRTGSDPTQKQYYTSFFPKEKAVAEKKSKQFALEYVNKKQVPVPDKNAPPNDSTRKTYDSVFQAAFNEEFERSFCPIDYFYLSVRNFYATAITELQNRFNFSDDIYDLLPMIKPKNARQLSHQSLSSLFKRFPVLHDFVNENDAESEWRAHVNLPDDYFDISSDHEYHNMDPEFYWNRVFDSKSPSGEPRFNNLKVCISLLLSLPFSNASAERCFSKMKDMKPSKKAAFMTNLSMP